jgi:hypothetical protein
VYPTLTSDPPLDAVGILSLLAGADPNTVLSFDAASRSAAQTRLAATGAATLAAGRLSEEVGLERGAEKLLGLNRFSIDPGLNRYSVDPSVTRGAIGSTARLTVGKRLTPDVNVLYSVDLGGTAERLISLEYTLSDRFSLLLFSAEPAGVRVRPAPAPLPLMVTALAVLALLSAAEPRPSRPVAAVEIDAPGEDASALRAFVELQPGDAYDAEVVRHAVELLYATGRYQDVVVEGDGDARGGAAAHPAAAGAAAGSDRARGRPPAEAARGAAAVAPAGRRAALARAARAGGARRGGGAHRGRLAGGAGAGGGAPRGRARDRGLHGALRDPGPRQPGDGRGCAG